MSLSTASAAISTPTGASRKRAIEHRYGAEQSMRFCIVCCEDTEVTQQISEEITKWDLPDVRSLLISEADVRSPINAYRHNLPESQATTVAQSEYAIFITPSAKPCNRIQVNPLNKACGPRHTPPAADSTPSTLLSAIHNCHGQSPQSWWLQVPTTKVSAKRARPISSQQSAAEALNQIVVFMRNYRTTAAPAAISTPINNHEKPAAIRAMAADKLPAGY